MAEIMTTAIEHWTGRSIDDYLYQIAADFVDQLQLVMNSKPKPFSQADLAKKLGITKGRVSQIFNNPGNLTLKQIIRYARALGLDIALVAYTKKASESKPGPINSDIFRLCWEHCDSPDNFRDVKTMATYAMTGAEENLSFDWGYMINGQYKKTGQTDVLKLALAFASTGNPHPYKAQQGTSATATPSLRLPKESLEGR
jgi:transcriptional regulator with XRE-family HTH domain